MHHIALSRRLVAELLGTAFLLAVVVGSGIMAEKLSGGNVGLALLANALATGAGLYALILMCGSISGAHFNPVVSLYSAMERHISWREAGFYSLAQIVGAMVGVIAAHLMFAEPLVSWSHHVRTGGAQWWSEFVATFGLLAVIVSTSRSRPESTPSAVAAYITAAYWFTASTSFAADIDRYLCWDSPDGFARVYRCTVDSVSGQFCGIGLVVWFESTRRKEDLRTLV
jgi:glycerol uptake facilitator-like aquaporin